MKINLAKSAGFCFGVKRAIDIALKTAASGRNIYMLGDIVHNEDVVRQIEGSGIKKIKRISSGKDKTLLIRAHGTGLKTFKKAKQSGYAIIDATCPMVKEIQKIAHDMEEKGYAIIVIGDKLHDEVHGICGQLKGKAIVIDEIKRIPVKTLKKIRKACVVSQSTQNLEKVLTIVDALRPRIADLRFFNTICKPTRMRQEETKRLPIENDVVIIIGSKNSANTKRLYEISKRLNKRSYWVGSKKDIRRSWFRGARTVGITAGASTPDSTTKDIIAYLKQICSKGRPLLI
jgi:4-hydroxy-3-methylbut-2-enyl diphosphate reductase